MCMDKKTRVFEVGRLKILSKKKGLMGSYWLKEDVSVDDNWRMRWIGNKVGGEFFFFFFFFILWIREKFTSFAFYVWFWDVDFETHLNPFLLLASMYDSKGRLGIASNGKQYENEYDIWEIIFVDARSTKDGFPPLRWQWKPLFKWWNLDFPFSCTKMFRRVVQTHPLKPKSDIGNE